MRGGILIGNGNNTCVYNPPVDCADDSVIPDGHVSRIVPSDSIEPGVQEKIKAAFANLNPHYLKNFNFATKICTARFKESDLTKPCNVDQLRRTIKAGTSKLLNMLTPIQESDVNQKDNTLYKDLETTSTAIRELLHAIIEMNSYSVQVFHTDAHIGNISWKGPNIVLHDWEKALIGDEILLKNINGSDKKGWRLLNFEKPKGHWNYLDRFSSWYYLIEPLEYINKMIHTLGESSKELNMIHQILFRFWDVFSIGVTLRQFFALANVAEPLYIQIFLVNASIYLGKLLTEEATKRSIEKKAKLDAITIKLHEILEEAVLNKPLVKNNSKPGGYKRRNKTRRRK